MNIIPSWNEHDFYILLLTVEELYGDERGEKPEFEFWEPEPPLLRSEIERAVRRMKRRKAEGSDGIVVMIEAAGEFATVKIAELADKIYKTG